MIGTWLSPPCPFNPPGPDPVLIPTHPSILPTSGSGLGNEGDIVVLHKSWMNLEVLMEKTGPRTIDSERVAC